jgi:hypothetical protein
MVIYSKRSRRVNLMYHKVLDIYLFHGFLRGAPLKKIYTNEWDVEYGRWIHNDVERSGLDTLHQLSLVSNLRVENRTPNPLNMKQFRRSIERVFKYVEPLSLFHIVSALKHVLP